MHDMTKRTHDQGLDGEQAALHSDKQESERLGIGMTLWLSLQREPGFPAPVWLGPRCKRHVPALVDGWLMTRRERPEGSREATQRAARAGFESRVRRAAERAVKSNGNSTSDATA